MIGSRLIKSNNAAAGCVDIVDAYDPFGGNGVALYQLNGNGVDLSGNYSANSTNNVAWVNGVFGQAAQFNGSNAIIDTPVIPITNTSTFTNSSWVYISSLSIGNIIPFSQVSSSNSNTFISISIRPSSNNVELIRKDTSSVGIGVYEPYTWSVGWHHVVWVCAPTNSKLYINGSQIANTNYTQTSPLSFTTQSIGARLRPVQMFYAEGIIDQNRFFNTALDPLEVEALYTEELCICGGTVDTLDILDDSSCIALYPLDGNANDLSGNYGGTPTNVSYGVGEFDLAGNFKALQGNIITPVGIYNNSFSGHSVSFWMYSGGTNYETPFYTRTAANPAAGWYIRTSTNGNGINWSWQNSSGSVVFSSSELSFTFVNSWHHVVATWDGTTNTNGAKLYIDNSLFDQRTANATLASQTFSLGATLGADRQSAGRSIQGLDQVRIFNKALSTGEVTTLYNETACTYTPAYEPIVEDSTDPFGDGSEYALYKFDNNVIDSEGSYNGLVSGSVAYTTGVFGQAINLTGTNASVEIPNFSTSDFSNKNVSVSCWVNMQSLVTGSSSKGAHLFTVGSGSWAVSVSQVGIGFAKYLNGSSNYALKDTTPVNLNEWYHIVATDSTSTGMKIYVNGIIVASVNYTGAIDLTYNDIGWGYYNDYQDRRGFTGYVDQGRIFNKTLTASEVYALYNE